MGAFYAREAMGMLGVGVGLLAALSAGQVPGAAYRQGTTALPPLSAPRFSLPNPVTGGDTVVVAAVWSPGGNVFSVRDDRGTAYPAAVPVQPNFPGFSAGVYAAAVDGGP